MPCGNFQDDVSVNLWFLRNFGKVRKPSKCTTHPVFKNSEEHNVKGKMIKCNAIFSTKDICNALIG